MTTPSRKLSKIDPRLIPNLRNSAEAWLQNSYCTTGRESTRISGLRSLWTLMRTCNTVTCMCVSTGGHLQGLSFPRSTQQLSRQTIQRAFRLSTQVSWSAEQLKSRLFNRTSFVKELHSPVHGSIMALDCIPSGVLKPL